MWLSDVCSLKQVVIEKVLKPFKVSTGYQSYSTVSLFLGMWRVFILIREEKPQKNAVTEDELQKIMKKEQPNS